MQQRVGWKPLACAAGLAALVAVSHAAPASAQPAAPATPPEMVATYNALADAILALKQTETDLVRSILAATYAHAQVQYDRAQHGVTGGDATATRAAVESLAADVGQLATEGDNAVGAVRKRLVQGGHHHNSAGEAQGLYDEGYVIVTRAAKQKLLESSRAIGQLSGAPKMDALGAEWKKVQAAMADLLKPAR